MTTQQIIKTVSIDSQSVTKALELLTTQVNDMCYDDARELLKCCIRLKRWAKVNYPLPKEWNESDNWLNKTKIKEALEILENIAFDLSHFYSVDDLMVIIGDIEFICHI